MKLEGQELNCPNVVTLVLPRGNNKDIVIEAKAVLDFDEFNKLCPAPKPKIKLMKGGKRVLDTDDETYKIALNNYAGNRIHYLFIKSLEANKGLTWETVQLTDPTTWGNYEKELKDAFFSEMEINRIMQAVFEANCLDEKKLDEARDHFLLSQAEPAKS